MHLHILLAAFEEQLWIKSDSMKINGSVAEAKHLSSLLCSMQGKSDTI